jgi:hypothetical protein
MYGIALTYIWPEKKHQRLMYGIDFRRLMILGSWEVPEVH